MVTMVWWLLPVGIRKILFCLLLRMLGILA